MTFQQSLKWISVLVVKNLKKKEKKQEMTFFEKQLCYILGAKSFRSYTAMVIKRFLVNHLPLEFPTILSTVP